MKKIGNAQSGDFIVEMTRDEVLALDRLAMTIEGKTAWEAANALSYSGIDECDLSTAIGCVIAFAVLVGTLNDVERLVAGALAALKSREGKKGDKGDGGEG